MEQRFIGTAEWDGARSGAPEAVVVIDVLRAFTTASWAFARGAERIVLAGSLEEARALKSVHPDWLTLKDGPPEPGFDTVNSPALVRSLDLTGRTLVQKTTNGTVGTLAARDAPLLLCAGFTVAAATADVLRAVRPRQVTYLITGGGGRAEEDLACARYIAELAAGPVGCTADPVPYLHRAAASAAAADIADGVRRGYPGVHPGDTALCLEADVHDFAMAARVEEGSVVLRRRDGDGDRYRDGDRDRDRNRDRDRDKDRDRDRDR
ncbi:2-phosphosulfolactate phosphatase [Streptomyces sp. NPDC005811]|uniref:2-phosphosulfolactate phosphatase n=1 Tax=Streptomyces sp. NPDC005811 TaxID=3154565 RepID=UPI0033DDA287